MAAFSENSKGTPLAGNVDNCLIALKELGYQMQHNEFTLSNEFSSGRAFTDDDASRIRHRIETTYGWTPVKESLRDAIVVLAHGHLHHPVRKYLKHLVWDEQERLSHLAAYFSAPDTPAQNVIAALIFRGIVARVLEPGAKFDYMPILYGAQGTGKSSALAIIGGDWYGDGPDLSSYQLKKHVAEKARNKVVLEQAELSGMNKADAARLKDVITQTHDNERLAYERHAPNRGRQYIFVGTANTILLPDITGNRRFPVLHCGIIDTSGLKRDRDQLFAEAVATHKPHIPVQIPEELWKEVEEDTDQYRVISNLEEFLAEYLEGSTKVGAREMRDALFDARVRYHDYELGRLMGWWGWRRRRIGKTRASWWVKES